MLRSKSGAIGGLAAALAVLALAPPAHATLGFRKPLTVQAGQVVGGPLTDFPVLVSLTDLDLRTVGNLGKVTSARGFDIQFRASNGTTVLDHEIESYDGVTGTLVAWVRVPSLANGTQLFMYYGDPFVTCPLANPGGVWDPNYRAVYHLSNSFLDSTTNHQDAVNGGTADVAGQIGRGRNASLAPPDIIQGNYTEALAQFTFSAWVRWNGTAGGSPRLFQKVSGATSEKLLYINTAGAVGAISYESGDGAWRTSATLTAGAWAHVAVVDNQANPNPLVYVNGALAGFAASTPRTAPAPSTLPFTFANREDLQQSLDGLVDEMRISASLRSAGWIATEYNNQSAPAGFFAVGAEETPTPTSAGGCPAAGQPGKDGAFTAPAGATVVNKYAVLGLDAPRGATSLTVAYPGGPDGLTAAQLSAGDLLLVIQMQGANMDVSDTPRYGQVTRLNGAGLHEFVSVAGVAGNVISLSCARGLRNSYSAAGRTQVIRVPQYSFLTVGAGQSLVAPFWNATSQFYGGVVAVRADTASVAGSIDVSGRGFRGGQDLVAAVGFGSTVYVTANSANGAEKGESIAGNQAGYDILNGRYGRGAPANGGGGGNGHNASGGGGANGHNGLVWNGQGNPDTSGAGWATAWNLDPSLTSTTTSSGGGRGGYTFSNANLDALTVGPGNAGWMGDNRREVGGLGGHPLPDDAGSRVFMGGGGGAGHTNTDLSSDGGDGGGIIFLLARSVSGGGSLQANGTAGDGTTNFDGSGGGGGGGSIVVNAVVNIANMALQANGGVGGSQPVPSTPAEAEGPGGGGGGGFIALTATITTAVTQSAAAGANGTTAAPALSEFPPNGATRGAPGVTAAVANAVAGGCIAALTLGPGCPAGTVPTGPNLIVNDDFSAGTAGWTSGVPIGMPERKPADTGVATQTGEKCYGGGPAPVSCNATPLVHQVPFPGDPLQLVAATNTWLYANGNNTGGPYRIWEQTVNGLTVGATYVFFAYASNAVAPGNGLADHPFLGFRKDGVALAPPQAVPYTSVATGDVWQRHQDAFVATAGSATLSLFDSATGTSGDDLALTRIGLQACAATTEVTLLSFAARGLDGAVDLAWETGSELRNLGFHLYRGPSAEGPFERITSALIPGLGSSPAGQRYAYRDTGLLNGVTYFYRLEDVETTGRRTSHGPVSATPASSGNGGGDGVDDDPKDGDDPDEGSSEYARHGDPGLPSLAEIERGPRHVVIELRTPGFLARAAAAGSFDLAVPGFEIVSRPGLAAVPVRRAFVEALAGRGVRVASTSVFEPLVFRGLRPSLAAALEVRVAPDGTVRPGRRRVGAIAEARGAPTPVDSARLVGIAFQGETKKAELLLAPLRWNAAAGELVLARRLRVRLEFVGNDRAEIPLGGARGRRARRPGRPVVASEVHLVVGRAGLQRVAYEDVYPVGSGPVPLARLRLSRQGVPVAFHVDAPSFRPGASLYFLSAGPDLNPYGPAAVYELARAAGGVSMPTSSATLGSGGPEFALKTRTFEQNRNYQPGLLEAPELWLWEPLVSPTTRSYPFTIDAVAPASVASRLVVRLQGGSDFEAAPDHHVRLAVNGVPIGEGFWEGKTAQRLEAEIVPGVLREGTNVLEIENVGDTGAAYSLVLLDRFEVTYPRLLEAASRTFEGRFTEGGRALVRGLPAGSFVLDTSQDVPRWLRGMAPSSNPTGLLFSVEIGHSYAAYAPSVVARPTVRRPRRAGLRSAARQADWIVVGPRELLAAAEPLRARRASQGLRARAVALEDVYDEFGHGEEGPSGLLAFLSFAYHSWRAPAPRYVVLLGDASYDPKDYIASGMKDWVPTPVVPTSFLRTASDPAYAAVNGEDPLPDFAIGRLPAANAAQAERLVQKILAFEERLGDPDPVVLVADNADAGGPFEANADEIASLLPGHEVERVYLRDGGDPRGRIRAALDHGASLVSYVGHGSIAAWASENVWNNLDVASLAPQPRQPLLLTLNCLNGFFHFPPLDSLAEAMVKGDERGAVAAISPSGLSLDAPAHLLHKSLVAELASGRHWRLGDAVLAAQASYLETGAFPELLRIYHLFGDPAMRIPR